MTRPRFSHIRRRATRACSLALCLLFLASGCMQSDGITWSSIYSTQAPAASEGQPEAIAQDSVLRVSMPTDSGSWDPAVNLSQSMQGLMHLCFETPVRLDDSLMPREQLVTWTQSADGVHWTFTVRGGVTFSDGTPLSAVDIIKSLDRILTVGPDGPYGWILDELTSWAIVDATTFTITAAEGGYGVLYAMVFPVMLIREDGYPLGTGPYRLAYYEPGSLLELDAQENWWRQTPYITAVHAVARDAASSGVVSSTHGESDPEMATFALGEIDLARTRSVTASQYRQAGVSATQDYMTQGYDALFFNFDRAMMADPAIRTAIAHAIDRQDIIANIYQGHAIAADVPIAPDSWLYDMRLTGPAFDSSIAHDLLEASGFIDADGDGSFDLKPLKYRVYTDTDIEGETPSDVSPTPPPQDDAELSDPQTDELLAALLMGETVYNPASLEPFALLTNYDKDNPVRRDAALRIARQLQSAGLPVEVSAVTLEELPAALEEGAYDLALLGYQIPLSCDLTFLLSAHYQGEQAGHLITHFGDTQMEARLRSLDSAKDETAYKAAVAAMADRIFETTPFIGLFFRMNTLTTRESLRIPTITREERPFRGIESWYFVEPAAEG